MEYEWNGEYFYSVLSHTQMGIYICIHTQNTTVERTTVCRDGDHDTCMINTGTEPLIDRLNARIHKVRRGALTD